MDYDTGYGEAKLEGVDEAPCYYPTVAQFAEPLEFIASIRPEAERYGICRICPPPGWKPQFAHKPDKLKFATKEQDLGKLAGAQRLRRKFTENLRKFLFLIGKPMESARGGKVFIGNSGEGPVDMFLLFKEVQKLGGHDEVARSDGWTALANGMGFATKGLGLRELYQRYLGDFEAVHRGRELDWQGRPYTPIVYREKPSVDADIRVGMSLWQYLEEEHGAGRCYHGTVKTLRASNCIVEYDLAERFPEAHGRNSWDNASPADDASSTAGAGEGDLWDTVTGDWVGAGGVRVSSYEEVDPFRVTLPRSQLSTLLLNGKSPESAKLAAHGVVCEVCSIAAASKDVLAVCVACDSAYHLVCVEPALERVPFNDWFCGDCANDGSSAEDLARGSSGLFSASSGKPVSSPLPDKADKTSRKVSGDSVSKLPAGGAGGGTAGGDEKVCGGTAAAAAAGGADADAAAGSATPNTTKTDQNGPISAATGPPNNQEKKVLGVASSKPMSAGDTNTLTPASPYEVRGGNAGDGDVGGKEAAAGEVAAKELGAEAGEPSTNGSTAHADGAPSAAVSTANNKVVKKEDEAEDASASDSEAGGASATMSAARMRGVTRMKGRALKYGFGNGGVYSLKEFALMADGWRSSYLARRGLGDEASEAEMEEEFWKLVGPDPPEDDVKVLYGSDLDTGAVGSGFPWARGAAVAPGKPATSKGRRPKVNRAPSGREWEYASGPASYENHSYEEDAWNLNCLPTSDGSLLQFLGTQIQGVMVPWLYVGMAFSAFCWHNEDHYLYSINYLHAGSPKRWYGVPGSLAEKFESTVRSMFPELFEAHPDLLMQLVTMAHPSEVAKRGVAVSCTTQREGEFVLTFPQAYHAGFNMGTNCAEAVNFAPPDWIPWGHAAQERYRLHRRKPVFSHEGLVLSLVDLLSNNSTNRVHASEELTRFLRNELEVLAAAQERGQEKAELAGCTRFEPMEKLVELLRGSGTGSGSRDAPSASSIVRRSSTCSDRNSGRDHSFLDGDGGGVLEGLESGSAVQGPRCRVCDQYCFLAVVVCHNCGGGSAGRTLARGSSGGGGSGSSPAVVCGEGGSATATAALVSRRRHVRRRFVCGRHLADLCQCSASEYTYYQRKDAAQLRAAAKGLISSEERAEAWVEKAKMALTAAKGTSGGMASSLRSIRLKHGSASDSAESTAAADAAATGKAPNVRVKVDGDPQSGGNGTSSASEWVEEEREDEKGDMEAMSLQLEVPADDEEAPLPFSLLPTGWHERPSLRCMTDLIRVGEELTATREHTLDRLRDVVDACSGWVKTIEGILGAVDSDGAGAHDAAAAAMSSFGNSKRTAATVLGGDYYNGGGDRVGGRGRGRGRGGRGRGGRGSGGRDAAASPRGGTRAESSAAKRREQVPFHKATKLLSTEAKLPVRPVETTERLCTAILKACRLRLQVRSLLGLGEDEHIAAVSAMCLTIQEAGRKAPPLDLASNAAMPSPSNTATGTAEPSLDSKPVLDGSGGSRGSTPPSLSGAAGPSAFTVSPSSGSEMMGVKTGGSGRGSGNETMMTHGSSPRLGSPRTRTRTNAFLPTGTLAAERGTWKLQPWRLWPVHQSAAAALVEPCLGSVVAIPEAALLKKALAALAERTDKAMRMDGGAGESAGAGGKRRRDSSGAGAGGGDSGGGDGDGGRGSGGNGLVRGKSRASVGGGYGFVGGGKTKLSGSPTSQPFSSKGGGIGVGGGVLVGGAYKRRRQDDS